jgi:ABC-type polysaccharide/polyol phosphate export permease
MNDHENQFATYDSHANKGFISFLSRNFRELIMYRYALYNFISTNLRARYRRSTIGFLWTLLNPLLTMVILAVVFSSIYNTSFADFGIYLFSGMLPWHLISGSIVGGAMSIVSAEGYLKKVYVPKLIFPIKTVGIEMINFLFSFSSLSLLALLLGAKIGWVWLLLPAALSLTAFFVLGFSIILSIITVYFRDLSHITQIVFFGLFYLTPIIYKEELLNSKDMLVIVQLNPFYYFIELFHKIIYEGITPSLSTWLMCGGLVAVSMIIGLIVFYFKERDVIYRL